MLGKFRILVLFSPISVMYMVLPGLKRRAFQNLIPPIPFKSLKLNDPYHQSSLKRFSFKND